MNLVVYITDKCNLSCKYCFVEKNNNVMSIETYKKIIEEYKDLIDSITFFGGEPLLRLDLVKLIIEYNEKNGYDFAYTINTNGINIDEEVIVLCRENNILINVSLDGNIESNSKNRFDESTFKVVENNIRKLIKVNIKFVINYVVTPNNLDYIYESLKYFAQNKFFEVSLMINYDAFWTKENIEQLRVELEKAIPLMLKIIDNKFFKVYPIFNKLNYLIEGKACTKCNFGKDSVVVTCEGKKYPCIAFVSNEKYEVKEKNQTFENLCNIERCNACEYESICDNNCMCRNCCSNKCSEVDVNCECEKIFIGIAQKVLTKMMNHEFEK